MVVWEQSSDTLIHAKLALLILKVSFAEIIFFYFLQIYNLLYEI
jgi:hypothetical protein